MRDHLWIDGPAPAAYVRYRLMARFGWTPRQIREEMTAVEMMELLAVMATESAVSERKRSLE